MSTPNGHGPQPQVVPPTTTYDTGNGLMAERPAQITTSRLAMPGYPERVCLTIRTETTTLTVLLSKSDAQSWAAQLATEASGLSGSGLITGKG